MVTRQVYELERWDLSRSDYASFGLFKSITGIAASWGLAGPLSRRFCQGCGTEHLVKGAAASPSSRRWRKRRRGRDRPRASRGSRPKRSRTRRSSSTRV